MDIDYVLKVTVKSLMADVSTLQKQLAASEWSVNVLTAEKEEWDAEKSHYHAANTMCPNCSHEFLPMTKDFHKGRVFGLREAATLVGGAEFEGQNAVRHNKIRDAFVRQLLSSALTPYKD